MHANFPINRCCEFSIGTVLSVIEIETNTKTEKLFIGSEQITINKKTKNRNKRKEQREK